MRLGYVGRGEQFQPFVSSIVDGLSEIVAEVEAAVVRSAESEDKLSWVLDSSELG